MKQFEVKATNGMVDFLIEETAYQGVKQIGEVVAKDLELVTGDLPAICKTGQECTLDRVVLMGTIGKSELLDQLEKEHKISLDDVKGKTEVYLFQIVENPFMDKPEIKKLLVIAGSDKRGTIYGMFHLSKLCGVSPLIFWGDAKPKQVADLKLSLEERYCSKEPSVKYRGFFINDEWPAFGNWCVEHYGGVNAKAYKEIFILLLRMNGNYLWPAMWKSSFSEDGPGLLNAQLADTYGVIMGTSHHEPMCRAGVEWQQQYQQYGTDSAWSFMGNRDAISKFWEQGILRNQDYENVITIGMRGENDSKLLPEDATLQDNIEVVKEAIRVQNKLLKKHMNEDLKKVPRMLAIYKEVEDYYYGDENCEGLANWEELSDVIFLLSDDNYGNLRALPTKETRNHPGGYGMYYHFDYHGAPVSYEWVNCNRLTKTWEQMTTAYEAGVKDMWIVNVGDLKGAEYPLTYFMELAYDYDTWGITAPNKTEAFLRTWISQQFGEELTDAQIDMLVAITDGYTKWNAIRSPEAMREGLFHPTHFRECDRVWEEINGVMEQAQQLHNQLTGANLITYESMIYYPAMASLNLILMYLEVEQNKMLAQRGCVSANYFGKKVQERIATDICLVEEFHKSNHGKWNHCMSSAHTGFRGWDDKNWCYPTVQMVTPFLGGKAVISFRGSDSYHLGAHWQDNGPQRNEDFTRPEVEEVLVDLDSRGSIAYSYEVENTVEWLICKETKGRVEPDKTGRSTLSFTIDRTKLSGKEEGNVTIRIAFDDGTKTHSPLCFVGENISLPEAQQKENLFLLSQGYCSIGASHYMEKKDVAGEGFQTIAYLGREQAAIKAFPPMKTWTDQSDIPYVKYGVYTKCPGDYEMALYLMPRNPVEKGGRIAFEVSVNQEAKKKLWAVPEDYYTEWFNNDWSDGVLSHCRIVKTNITLHQGLNEIFIYAGEPGLVLEKIVVYPKNVEFPTSYLGPLESFCFHN